MSLKSFWGGEPSNDMVTDEPIPCDHFEGMNDRIDGISKRTTELLPDATPTNGSSPSPESVKDRSRMVNTLTSGVSNNLRYGVSRKKRRIEPWTISAGSSRVLSSVTFARAIPPNRVLAMNVYMLPSSCNITSHTINKSCKRRKLSLSWDHSHRLIATNYRDFVDVGGRLSELPRGHGQQRRRLPSEAEQQLDDKVHSAGHENAVGASVRRRNESMYGRLSLLDYTHCNHRLAPIREEENTTDFMENRDDREANTYRELM